MNCAPKRRRRKNQTGRRPPKLSTAWDQRSRFPVSTLMEYVRCVDADADAVLAASSVGRRMRHGMKRNGYGKWKWKSKGIVQDALICYTKRSQGVGGVLSCLLSFPSSLGTYPPRERRCVLVPPCSENSLFLTLP
jgi:hypothetical protein